MRGTAINALLLAILLAALPSCEPGDDPPDDVVTEPADPGLEPGWSGRPPEREDTLVAEDLAVPVTLYLFETTGHFPIPFSAYHADDMEVTQEEVDDGDVVRFQSLRADGEVAGEMEFFVYADGVGTSEARRQVRDRAAELGEVREEERPVQDWAREEYRFRGEGRVGRVSWGEIEGRAFHLLVQFAPEAQGTFAPKARMITDTWRWQEEEVEEEVDSPVEGEEGAEAG